MMVNTKILFVIANLILLIIAAPSGLKQYYRSRKKQSFFIARVRRQFIPSANLFGMNQGLDIMGYNVGRQTNVGTTGFGSKTGITQPNGQSLFNLGSGLNWGGR